MTCEPLPPGRAILAQIILAVIAWGAFGLIAWAVLEMFA